jgi:hypothetical protein
MKTPRELLLARHADAQPKLDALRERVVADHVEVMRVREPVRAGVLMPLWRELFWSCRRAWLGLASAWGLILILHLTGGPTTAAATGLASRRPSSADIRLALAEQTRLRAELLGVPSQSPKQARKPLVPGPRSEAVAAPSLT